MRARTLNVKLLADCSKMLVDCLSAVVFGYAITTRKQKISWLWLLFILDDPDFSPAFQFLVKFRVERNSSGFFLSLGDYLRDDNVCGSYVTPF